MYWRKNRLIGVSIIALFCIAFPFSVEAQLANSPWPGYGYDNYNSGLSPSQGTQTDSVKWTFETGNILDSPSIGPDGTIYVGSWDDSLYAVNKDGSKKWAYGASAGFDTAPAIDEDGTIYAGSNDGRLYAINPDGTEKWHYQTEREIKASPTIGDDGTVYVVSVDENLYAINPDGTEKWTFDIGNFNVRKGSPVVDNDGNIYVTGTDSLLYSIAPDGTENWTYSVEGELGSFPAMSNDGTLYLTVRSGAVHAVDTEGNQQWTHDLIGSLKEMPAIGPEGTIYVGTFGFFSNYFYAINPDGTEKWSYTPANDESFESSPVVGTNGTIYVGADNSVLAIDSSGSKLWKHFTADRVTSAAAIGSNGTVYVGSNDNNLYAFGGPTTTDIADNTPSTPDQFHLSANYPNPFNPSTNISFTLPRAAQVQLDVYDATGRHVRSLVNKQLQAGQHRVNFKASDLPSGVYLYRLQTNEYTEFRKMLLVK